MKFTTLFQIEKQVIYPPDILIVEGINVLQLPPNREILRE